MARCPEGKYPVRFSVDYPEGSRDRLTVLPRAILAIPILVISLLLELVTVFLGVIFLPTVLMIVFRDRYPTWWFDHNLEILRFLSRVRCYTGLLRDEYPSTDEGQAVHLEIPYPEPGHLNRYLPLVKWLLAFPHYSLLFALRIASLLVSFVAWLTILITGRHPKWMYNFTLGVIRWRVRVLAYAFMLSTDRYPPFRLGP